MRRLPFGGAIDRARPLGFRYNGSALTGLHGDTLASALLGAGVDVVGHSISYGRPRGIMSAGMEEATGFAQIVTTVAAEPLQRMTGVTLYEGLVAESRITKGELREAPDDARFDKRYAHCDLLVIGAGPAGIAAALVASRAGARVILCESDDAPGGALPRDNEEIDGQSSLAWIGQALAALGSAPDTRVLLSTTATIAMDQNGFILVQRMGCRLPLAERDGLAEQRLWQVRPRAVILATGTLERPIVFQDNDRPGILLAGAARTYLHRFALAPERGLVFTTTDDGYRTALDWHAAGTKVAGVIDPRAPGQGDLPRRLIALGIPLHSGSVVLGTLGDTQGRFRAARVRTPAGVREVEAGLLAVSGGHEPALNLHEQRKGATHYDPRAHAVVPTAALPGQWIAGGANGCSTLGGCLADGARAAQAALSACGFLGSAWDQPRTPAIAMDDPAALWHVPAPDGDDSRSFVDLHRDATIAGVTRAVASGIRHVEHVKRYTLIGTGVDQGRSAKSNAGAVTAAMSERPVADAGTSGSRPPVEPMVFCLLGGRAMGPRYDPVRTTSLHEAHVAGGAVFETVGQWLRPNHFPRPGESKRDAIRRECRAARTGVAIVDASTLGKVDVRGPDATWFLEQLYANSIASIAVGKARYSVLCHLDGSVLDDGLVMRLADQRYYVTTSTGHAAAVVDWMEEWLQTEWPHRRVWITPVTEQYATVAVVGPLSRQVMAQLAPGLDAGTDAFPFLGLRRAAVAGVDDALIARVSFSGELAFEITIPWTSAPLVWDALLTLGEPLGITPYGLDTLQVLRMEKGYIIVGQDTEALTTPYDAGLGWMVAKQKTFVGKRALQRPALRADDRPELVGFVSRDPSIVVPEGAGLVSARRAPPMQIEGHVTSSCWSEALGAPLGLALVRGGRARHGQVLHAPLDGHSVALTLVDPIHYDPKGARRDG